MNYTFRNVKRTSARVVLLFIGFITFFSFSLPAQEGTVSGTVTAEGGAPLAGASITVKGTTRGTSTNASGRFSISASPDATLVISSVGHTIQEVPVGGRTEIAVSLAAATTQLEQVVVVGYGTQRRRDVTGSVASVSGAEIAKQPVLTATQAIQGRVAGVQIISSGAPNANPIVRVRGVGSMLGGANPLYVVDGVITDDIRNINSADIVSMDILKDASATAIYGMRAANGVLIITTKKGRPGKMIVSYDANVGIKEATNLVNMAGANQYAGYVNEASIYYGTGDSLVTSAMLRAGGNTDWYDAILRRGFQQNHNVSIAGGGGNINYFLSAGYISDEGIIETNKFDRFTLRSNNDYKLSNSLRLSTLVSYSRFDLRDVDLNVFNIAYRAAPYVQAKVGDKYGNTSLSNNIANPLLNLEKTNNNGLGNRLQGTFAADFKPLTWLTLRSSIGVDLDFYKNTNYAYKYLNQGPDNVFITAGGNQLRNNSGLTVTQNEANRWVWDNTATIAKVFARHNLNLLVGTTAEQYRFSSLVGSRIDVPESPDQWFLGAGSTTGGITNNQTGEKWSRNSYISRLNYSYDNRYSLTATLRADGTSRFPSQNRWGYFPSVGAGWTISREAFMANQSTFSNLRLRASWGRVGNDNIPTNLFYSIASINIPYFLNGAEYPGIIFPELPDRNLKWETTTEVDFGLEFGVLKNKLTGTIDYYNKKTTDALINIRIAGILPDADKTYTTNAASFENKGFEVSLGWTDNINKDWSYNISANTSFNKNQITGLNGGQALLSGNIGGNQGNTTRSDNGQPIGSFFLYEVEGIFQTEAEVAASAQKDQKPGDLKYKDLSGPQGKPDGEINEFDKRYFGAYIPKVTYGINGGVNFKSLDFSFNTYGTSGGKIYNGKKAARINSLDNVETDVALNRWTPNNRNTSVPRANLNQIARPSNYFLEKGDFFRINNLTLGYTLPKNVLTRYHIQNLRMYITAQNLATFTGYTGFTPELAPAITTSDPAGALAAGIELGIYPTTRTFAFGINVGF